MNEPLVVVREPQSAEEWKQYYHLRWHVLRRPWGQPEGSEKDAQEDATWHRAVFLEGLLVGVSRLQLNSPVEGQIRYMAIADDQQGKGFGRLLVAALEEIARDRGAKYIRLDARENARGFYLSLGYEVVGDSYLLFGEIQHYLMQKNLY